MGIVCVVRSGSPKVDVVSDDVVASTGAEDILRIAADQSVTLRRAENSDRTRGPACGGIDASTAHYQSARKAGCIEQGRSHHALEQVDTLIGAGDMDISSRGYISCSLDVDVGTRGTHPDLVHDEIQSGTATNVGGHLDVVYLRDAIGRIGNREVNNLETLEREVTEIGTVVRRLGHVEHAGGVAGAVKRIVF